MRASRSQQEAGELIPGSRSAATRPPVGWAELPPAHAPAFWEEGVSGIPGGAWSAIDAEGPQEGCLESGKHASTLLHPAGQLTGWGHSAGLLCCVSTCAPWASLALGLCEADVAAQQVLLPRCPWVRLRSFISSQKLKSLRGALCHSGRAALAFVVEVGKWEEALELRLRTVGCRWEKERACQGKAGRYEMCWGCVLWLGPRVSRPG